jgi:hypothetical protein
MAKPYDIVADIRDRSDALIALLRKIGTLLGVVRRPRETVCNSGKSYLT